MDVQMRHDSSDVRTLRAPPRLFTLTTVPVSSLRRGRYTISRDENDVIAIDRD